MQTIGKSGIFKPKIYSTNKEALTIHDALLQKHWKSAMRDEVLALERNNTWFLVPLPPNQRATGCKWIFKTKENLDGSVHKYKAKLVPKVITKLLDLTFY